LKLRRVSILGVLAVALVLTGTTGRAGADMVSYKRMRFVEKGGLLGVTVNFTELFDEVAYENLSSGFPTTVVVRMYVYRKKNEAPVSMALASFRVVYDLWNENFMLETEGPLGRKTRKFEHRSDALQILTSLKKFPVASLSEIDVGPHYFLAMVVELNPVGEELLAETRRWLSESSDERFDTGASFFGSFVSVFVNPKLKEADRVLRLRSQPFYRVPR
jgi:hypothetical protein